MCSGVNRVSIFAWTESPPQRGPSPHFRVDQVRFSVRIGKSRNLSKIVSALLSASVERVGVSRMHDFSSCVDFEKANFSLGENYQNFLNFI